MRGASDRESRSCQRSSAYNLIIVTTDQRPGDLVLLGPLYHWSPADRYDSIRAHGLIAGSESTIASATLPTICLGFDPQLAWRLSGAMEWASEIEQWDLWQVELGPKDDVRVRAEFGPQLWEVKVGNHIPSDRLWYVGRRDSSCWQVPDLSQGLGAKPARRRKAAAPVP